MYEIRNTKWFGQPFDRLTVLSKVEGQYQMPETLSSSTYLKVCTTDGPFLSLSHSDFGFVSNFEIRISD